MFSQYAIRVLCKPYPTIKSGRKCVKTKYPLLIFTKLLLSQAEALICPKVFVALDTDLSLWQNALFEIATQLLGAFPLSVLMRIFPSMILSVSSKSTIGRTTTRKLQGRDWPRKRDARIGGPEVVFGQMKNNMHYKRFRHFGKDKVRMDFAFFAMTFNLKNYAQTS